MQGVYVNYPTKSIPSNSTLQNYKEFVSDPPDPIIPLWTITKLGLLGSTQSDLYIASSYILHHMGQVIITYPLSSQSSSINCNEVISILTRGYWR